MTIRQLQKAARLAARRYRSAPSGCRTATWREYRAAVAAVLRAQVNKCAG